MRKTAKAEPRKSAKVDPVPQEAGQAADAEMASSVTSHKSGRTRKRIPKLSKKPDPTTGKYYVAYTDERGKFARERFSASLSESQTLYRRWVVNRYDSAVKIVQVEPATSKTVKDDSLATIIQAFNRHEQLRVRPEDSRQRRGMIGLRTLHENKKQALAILQWCKDRYGAARVVGESFETLMTANDYEEMMAGFASRLSDSQLSKYRQRFWEIVRFAKRDPFNARLRFDPDQVRVFGGMTAQRPRIIPTVDIIRQILAVANERNLVWIWMGLGMGFSQIDLAHCCPCHFSEDSYDMRRSKTGERFERYGDMPPMVWAHLKPFLDAHRGGPDKLLFTTESGLPLVWAKPKSEKEIAAQLSEGLKGTPYKRTDSVTQAWRRLKKTAGLEKWGQGFNIWRHLGATAYAARPGKGLLEVRTFLGHGRSHMADRYMKPLSKDTRRVTEWVNKMLDQSDRNAWKKAD